MRAAPPDTRIRLHPKYGPNSALKVKFKKLTTPVAVPANFEPFWNERCERLDRELERVANLAERQQLPDAEIREFVKER